MDDSSRYGLFGFGKFHYFAYHDVSDEEVMCSLEESIGWTRPKFAHDDCFAHAVAENMCIRKSGYPTRQGELAVEVRRGKLTVAEMDRILERDMMHYSTVPEETKERFERRIYEKKEPWHSAGKFDLDE